MALDNGRVQFSGSWQDFQGTSALHAIVLSNKTPTTDGGIAKREQSEDKLENDAIRSKESETLKTVEEIEGATGAGEANAQNSDTVQPARAVVKSQASEEETRQEGRISKDVWLLYFRSCGGFIFWTVLVVFLILGAVSPAVESVWLK